MLADLAAATTLTAPATGHDAYQWFSDIWLPAGVGVGSLLIAGIAVAVAARSNRLARAATRAAERSNAIAKRTLVHEERQAARAGEIEALNGRREYAARWLLVIDALIEDARRDPSYWTRPIEEADLTSMARVGPMLMEGSARWYHDFPNNETVQMVKNAAKAGGDDLRLLHAKTNAHALVDFWAQDPDRNKWAVAYYTDQAAKLNKDPSGSTALED